MLAHQFSARTARKHDLFAIDSIRTCIRGGGSISYVARTYLYFFLELVSRGYRCIEAPNAAIAHAQYLATGHTRSVRSLQRALAELSHAGFVRIKRCRIGYLSKKNVIILQTDRFDFLIRRLSHVGEGKKNSHKNLHATGCHPYDRMSNSDKSTHSNNYKISNKSNKHANIAKKKQRPQKRRDPRLYSLGLVLHRAVERGQMDRRTGRRIYIRCQSELRGGAPASGIDWRHYSPQYWIRMTWAERENVAETVLLPAFRSVGKSKKRNNLDMLVEHVSGATSTDSRSLTAQDIRAMVESSLTCYRGDQRKNITEESVLSDDEFRILKIQQLKRSSKIK